MTAASVMASGSSAAPSSIRGRPRRPRPAAASPPGGARGAPFRPEHRRSSPRARRAPLGSSRAPLRRAHSRRWPPRPGAAGPPPAPVAAVRTPRSWPRVRSPPPWPPRPPPPIQGSRPRTAPRRRPRGSGSTRTRKTAPAPSARREPGRSAPPYRPRTEGTVPRPAGRLAASTGARPRRPLESLARQPLYGPSAPHGRRSHHMPRTHAPSVAVTCADGGHTGARTEPPDVSAGARTSRRPAQRPNPASFALSCSTDFVWIWLTRLSVTPSTLPISARVSPS